MNRFLKHTLPLLLFVPAATLSAKDSGPLMQITQQALAGDARSQCNLGVSYMEVARSPKDYAEVEHACSDQFCAQQTLKKLPNVIAPRL